MRKDERLNGAGEYLKKVNDDLKRDMNRNEVKRPSAAKSFMMVFGIDVTEKPHSE